MSEQFLVSVIVPIYKVEAYIDKCIRSILKQTYKNYEVILVDDGSPDKCPDICDKYACEYDNIRVLHKKMEDYQMQEMQVFQLLEVSM